MSKEKRAIKTGPGTPWPADTDFSDIGQRAYDAEMSRQRTEKVEQDAFDCLYAEVQKSAPRAVKAELAAYAVARGGLNGAHTWERAERRNVGAVNKWDAQSLEQDCSELGKNLETLHHEVNELQTTLDQKRKQLDDGVKKFMARLQQNMSKKDSHFFLRLLKEVEVELRITRRIDKLRFREPVKHVRLIRNVELAKELRITPGAVTQRIKTWGGRNPDAWEYVKMERKRYMDAWKARDEAAYTGGESANMAHEARAIADHEQEKMKLRHSPD